MAKKEFKATDIVFANLLHCGRELASVCLTGVTSIGDIVRYLRTRLKGVTGLMVIKVRNASQGWAFTGNALWRPA